MLSLKGALGVWHSVLSLLFKELTRHNIRDLPLGLAEFLRLCLCLLPHSCEAHLLLFFMAKLPQNPWAQKSCFYSNMAWSSFTASLPGQRPQRNLGVRNNCLRPEVISQLSGIGSWIQLNSELPHAPTPAQMESSLFERQMILDPPLLTYIELFPFISNPFCIIPAINYSLENALLNIFFHYDCYGIF